MTIRQQPITGHKRLYSSNGENIDIVILTKEVRYGLPSRFRFRFMHNPFEHLTKRMQFGFYMGSIQRIDTINSKVYINSANHTPFIKYFHGIYDENS